MVRYVAAIKIKQHPKKLIAAPNTPYQTSAIARYEMHPLHPTPIVSAIGNARMRSSSSGGVISIKN